MRLTASVNDRKKSVKLQYLTTIKYLFIFVSLTLEKGEKRERTDILLGWTSYAYNVGICK